METVAFVLRGVVVGLDGNEYDFVDQSGKRVQGVSWRVFVATETLDGGLGAVDSCKVSEEQRLTIDAAGFGAPVVVQGEGVARNNRIDKRAKAVHVGEDATTVAAAS